MPTRHLFNDYEPLSNENDSLMQDEQNESSETQDTSDAGDDSNLLHFHTPMKEPSAGIEDLIGHADLFQKYDPWAVF